jgi:hypothetical protein
MFRSILLVSTLSLLAGCAAEARLRPETINFAVAQPASTSPLTVGSVHVLGERISPMMPVDLSASAGKVTVTFARKGLAGTTLALDPLSLQTEESSDHLYPESTKRELTHTKVAHVALDDGRRIAFWTDGNPEAGYRVLAAVERDGEPQGAPVVLTSESVDVIGSPSAVTTDGHHVVVTFFASTTDSFALLAVPVEAP